MAATALSVNPAVLALLERLAEFDVLLRDNGFPHGPDRWLNVHDLLVRMASEQRVPDDPEGLRPLLAPLFCSTPQEQARFTNLYADWVAGGGIAGPAPKVPRTRQPVDEPKLPRPARWPYAVACLVITSLLAYGFYRYITQPVVENPPPTNPEVQVSPPEPSLPDISASEEWQKLPLQTVPPRQPPEVPTLSQPRQSAVEVVGKSLPWLPALIAGVWLLWRIARRRVVLRRQRGNRTDPLAAITLPGPDGRLFDGPEVRAGVRRLHAPVSIPTRRLDAVATVNETVRHAGLFTPRFQARPEVPEVLLVVQYEHRADHMAGLGDAVGERLRDAGLVVCRFYYADSPQRVQRAAGGQWISIAELASRHANSRLIMVGDPQVFADPWGEGLARWADVLAAWPARGLLGTRYPGDRLERVMEDGGLMTAPLTADGIINLTARMADAPLDDIDDWPPPLPAALRDREAWLRPLAPPGKDIDGLLNALRRDQGAPGFLLLSAAAAYPSLHWGLTRALDMLLFPGATVGDGRERRLHRLAQLPWCRVGWMPDWLRMALQKSLSPVQRVRVRDAYRDLFQRATTSRAPGIRLPVALPPPPAIRLMQLWQRLRPRGRRFAQYVRDLRSQATQGDAARDRIFANLLLGGRLGVLDFELPRWLGTRLPGGVWLAAAGPVLAALLLAGVGGWGLTAAWQQWGKPVAEARLLTAQFAANGAYTVEIVQRKETEALAQALAATLEEFGFQVEAEPAAWPEFRDRGGNVREDLSLRTANTVHFSSGAARSVAQAVARRLSYLTYGQGVDFKEGVTLRESVNLDTGRLRVWLRDGGAVGSVFSDELRAASAAVPTGLVPIDGAFRDRLADGSEGPEMVMLPGGRFQMGCVSGKGCQGDELPVHAVTVAAFAIGRYEVTFEEYDKFLADAGKQEVGDKGWGRGRRPVINVSWQDASDYAQWLSQQTGKNYRLPTEAEWEYAARAGTQTPFSTGACIDTSKANYDGNKGWEDCPATGEYRRQTLPVGSFPANAFGLHDVHGNVWEWTQDCWHESYADAPGDGSAWQDSNRGACSGRVVRGGGWSGFPVELRSADRFWYSADDSVSFLGFRLARTP